MVKFRSVSAALLLISVFACSKNGIEQSAEPTPVIVDPSQDTLHFKASTQLMKSSMDSDGNMTWLSTDEVKFFDGTTTVTANPENISGATADFTVVGLNPQASRFYAAYPADMVNTFESDGDIVFNSYGTDMQTRSNSYCAVAACSKSDEMTMSFRNVSYILQVSKPSTGAGSDAVSVTFMSLDNAPVSTGVTVTLAGGDTPEIAAITPGSGTAFTASAEFDSNGIAVLNIDPVTSTTGFVLAPRDDQGRALGIQLYRKSHTFAAGYFYPWLLEIDVNPDPPTPVPPIDDLVFATGNLYYDNGNWGIEERAYDFRTWPGYPCCIKGVYTAESSGTDGNNVGLFYWTSDKDKSRAKTYSNDWSATAKSDKDFFANGIQIGGTIWRGITKAEFTHVGTGRTNADALRARATIMGTGLIQGITGVILFPDNFATNPGFVLNAAGQWVFPFGLVVETARSKPEGGFADNSFTLYQWAILQYLGCVFLPAAGKAGAQHAYIGGSLGELYYWTSYYYNKSGETHRACYVYGKEFSEADETYGDCQQAFAVRLVKSK